MDGIRYVLTAREEEVARAVVGAAYDVHRELGAGLLEHVYEVVFCHELKKRGLKSERQIAVPIVYDHLTFDEAFRIDVLVENLIVCEIKAVAALNKAHEAQLLTYLRFSQKRVGFLINFHADLMKHGLRRMVL